jgi:formamidopyrimidine-DNA glycosylase
VPTDALERDPRFATLGVEPLAGALDGALLRARAAGRRGPVKPFLMDAGVVVGVGNIYASESLFLAGIDPRRSVARIAAARWETLAGAVREVLARAIEQGGTTLNDFVDGEGNAGYFQVALAVYDREGRPCPRCGAAIRRLVQAGRSTYYCARCQR